MKRPSCLTSWSRQLLCHGESRAHLSLLILLTIASHPDLLAQTPWTFFNSLGVDDGLSQDIVTSIAQDQLGFMWFGTEDGLNRFDGIQFQSYRHNPDDPFSLPSNDISALCADRSCRIWVGTSSGQAIYDLRTDRFTVVRGAGGRVTDIAYSPDTLWIATKNGLLEICEQETVAHSVFGLTGAAVTAVETDGDSILWIGKGSKLLRIDRRTGIIDSIRFPFRFEPTGEILRIRKHPDGSIWIAAFGVGVFRYTSQTQTLEVFSDSAHSGGGLIDRSVNSLAIDSSGVVWAGSWSSVDRFDPGSRGFQHVVLTSRNSRGFLGQRVYALFVDRVGSLWIGTYRGGVNRLDPAHQHFTLLNRPGNQETSSLSVLTSPEGSVWVGTTDGLDRWSPDLRSVRSYQRTHEDGSSIPLREVTALCMRHSGALWLGTRNNSIARMDVHSGRITRFGGPITAPGKKRGGGIRVLFEDRSGTMWVGTDVGYSGCGLYSYDDMSQIFRRYQHKPIGHLPSGGGVWTIFEDSRGRYWVGGDGGYPALSLMDRTNSTLTLIPVDTSAAELYSTRAIVEDRSGTLWFGTWGGGLKRYNDSTSSFTRYREPQGLPSMHIKSMVLDGKDRIWLGTEHGIACFDIAAGRVKSYSKADGLPLMFFLSGAGSRGADGRIYLGGQGGVVAFQPESITDNLHTPPVAITRFTVFDRSMFGGGYVSAREIQLEHDQDFFGFEFVALDFTAPKQNRYAYMLEGIDEEWIDAGTRRYASYTHIPGGSYVFRVRAANNDGHWNETGASIEIIIAPPFWETWSFRIASLIAVAGGFTIYLRLKLQSVLKVERLRQRIARDLHDDVGTNLSTIVLAAEIAKNQGLPSDQAIAQMNAIAGTALQTQDLMHDIVWMLNPSNDSLESFVTRLKDTAARVLLGISFTFVYPRGEEWQNFDLEFKRNIILIYKEILNNIIRHSGATSVAIIFEQTNERLRLTVSDDGHGFDPHAAAGNGNGLTNMGQRATLVGGTVTVVSSPGNGATVLLDAKIA